jgi:oligopeptide/dipeptide ABC transporter ATP-binding protein
MELAGSRALFESPRHPYTKALLSAIPIADPKAEVKPEILKGEPPDPAESPPGCKFCGRCALSERRCEESEPALTEIEPGRWVRCHLVDG